LRKVYRPSSVALVIGVMCLSDSAFADWQGTVWNDSVEQTDRNFRVPHRTPTPDELQNWFGEIQFSFT
jgi:2-iminoacetate synthase ThiH